MLRLTTDSDDQWLTDTDSGDSSDDCSDSGESDTWGSYSGTSNSASGSAPDVQKQETLVEYVCRFCKGIVEDIGRMIAQLSETIRRTEEDAPKKQPKPEPESSDENALTDRQSRKGQISFAARKNSEAILKKYKSRRTRRRYGRQEIVETPSY